MSAISGFSPTLMPEASNKLASSAIQDMSSSDTRTLKEAYIDGLKYYWERTIHGSLYDFYPGMEINTSIVVDDYSGTGQYYDPGTNHNDRLYVILYSEKGRSYMLPNEVNIYSVRPMIDFYRSVSHEFGHILGIADYYSDAGNEIPYIDEVQLNPEIQKDGLMNSAYLDRIVFTANDVEMALYGAFDNSFEVSQHYIPGRDFSISSALREKILYVRNGNSTKYMWDETYKIFIPINSSVENYGSVKYYIDSDDITIVGLTEQPLANGVLSIPNFIDGYPVVKIGSHAFEDNNTIVSVNLPDTITKIGDFSFKGCSNLTSINLPLNLITIDSCAFYDCIQLSNLSLPDNLEFIGGSAFYNCYNIGLFRHDGGLKLA